jgi:chromosome segregation ATPase
MEKPMEQIINDLKSALAKMNERSDKFSAKTEELESLIINANKKISELVKREDVVKAKEDFYAGYDAVEKIRADVKSERISMAKEKSELEFDKKNLNSDKEEVRAEKENLAKTIALYKQKIENCDKEMKKLEDDRKQLEAKIIENFAKNLTKK